MFLEGGHSPRAVKDNLALFILVLRNKQVGGNDTKISICRSLSLDISITFASMAPIEFRFLDLIFMTLVVTSWLTRLPSSWANPTSDTS